MLKKCQFDKRHSKVISIERSYAAKKAHYIRLRISDGAYIRIIQLFHAVKIEAIHNVQIHLFLIT